MCNLPFENQLLGYIHYCTEIPEININLLPNTCNFHCKIRFIFSLHLSKNAQNVHFREAKFKNFPGELAPGPPPPQCTHAFGTPYYFCRTNSELLPPGLLFPMGNYVNKKMFLFSVENYIEIYILKTTDMRSTQA